MARYISLGKNSARHRRYETNTPMPCIHHWHIEESREITARGVCEKCGEVRQFYTFIDHEPIPKGVCGK